MYRHMSRSLWLSKDPVRYELSLSNYTYIATKRCQETAKKHIQSGFTSGIDVKAHEKYHQLVTKTNSRLSKHQLEIIRNWICTRNIWSYDWKKINENEALEIELATSQAFESLAQPDGLSEKGIERAIKLLTYLTGVGPAFAVAILSLNTGNIASFSEEAIEASNQLTLTNDLSSVLQYTREMQRCALHLGTHSSTGNAWTAREVEYALFSAEHGGLLNANDNDTTTASNSLSSSLTYGDSTRFMEGVRFVFTACCNSKQRDILKERLCAAGGLREYDQPINSVRVKGRKRLAAPVDVLNTTTHIIVSERLNENKKSSKTTLAEYLGYDINDLKNVWVVTSNWATESLRLKVKIDERIYLVRQDMIPSRILKQDKQNVDQIRQDILATNNNSTNNKRLATEHDIAKNRLASLLPGIRTTTLNVPEEDEDEERQTLQDPLLRPSTRYLNTTMSIKNNGASSSSSTSSTSSSSNATKPKGWMRALKNNMGGKSITCGQWTVSPTLLEWGDEQFQLYGSETSLDSWNSSLDRSRSCYAGYNNDDDNSSSSTSSSSSSSSFSTTNGNAISMHTPFITFVFSRGRWNEAGLVYSAKHVFGESLGIVNHGPSTPTVVIVITPEELGQYRGVLSAENSLILVLPQPGRAVGYARWCVQKLCSQTLRIPFYWSCDDNVVVILKMLGGGNGSNSKKSYEHHDKIAVNPGFLECFMSIQSIPNLERYGLIGLLRDRGTAKKCLYNLKVNVMSIYKCLLINAAGLEREGVEYNKYLKKWEDVSLNYRILEKKSLKTLKVAKFTYWAFASSSGGCSDERSVRSRVVRTIEDVVEDGCIENMEEWETKDAMRIVEWAKLVPGQRKGGPVPTDDDEDSKHGNGSDNNGSANGKKGAMQMYDLIPEKQSKGKEVHFLKQKIL